MIPDMIPVTALCSLLPQPGIQHALEKIKDSIIWDGRLSPQERRTLFQNLREFSGKNHKLTQMRAFATLAGIVNNIQLDNLALLKKEGVDDETLTTLLYIKTEAFRELHFLAKHYYLPHRNENILSSLPWYLYTNYLMWTLGYPQKIHLQPLFFTYKIFKLYFTLMFYKAILGGLIDIINRAIEEKNCLDEGKVWRHFDAIDKWECSVCGDQPVFYKGIGTIEECFAAYLAVPRTLDDLLTFINISNDPARSSFDLSKITEIDLSAQSIIFNDQRMFSDFLVQLKPKLTGLQSVYLYEDIEIDGLEIIAEFIKKTSVTKLIYGYTVFQEGFDALAEILPSTKIISAVK